MKRSLALLLFFLALLAQFQTYSQTFDWANLLQGIEGRAYAHQIITDSNDDVIIFGTFFNTIKLSGGPTPVTLTNSDSYSYFLAKYNNSGDLYWAKQFATINEPTFENHAGLAVDAGNNIYVAARVNSDITIEGATHPVSGMESFIMKYDPDGGIDPIFPIYLGGGATVSLKDIAITSANDILVLGNFNGALNLGNGVSFSSVGSSDIFIARYNASGLAVNATLIQSAFYEEGTALEYDNSNGFFVSGLFRGNLSFTVSGSPVTIDATSDGTDTDDDFFVAHFNGTDYSWLKHGKGVGNNVTTDMAINTGLDGIYLTGYFNDVMTVETSVTALGGPTQEDVFVMKLKASTGSQSWLVRGGGDSPDRGFGIIESGGDIIVAGRARGTAAFGSISLPSSFSTTDNAILLSLKEIDGDFTKAYRVESTGYSSTAFDIATDGIKNFSAGSYFDVIKANTLRWATGNSIDFFALTTNNPDLSIANLWGSYYWTADITDSDTDDSGITFVTGTLRGYFEEYLAGSYTSQGSNDIFIASFDNSGLRTWIEFGGGPGLDAPTSITVNKANDLVYLTGTFVDVMTIGSDTFVGNSADNIFIAKYDFTGPIWGIPAAVSTGNMIVNEIATDANGNAIITGNKGFTLANFGAIQINNTTPDFFVAKYDGVTGNTMWVRNERVSTGSAVAVDNNNDIIVGGYFNFSTTFAGTPISPTGGSGSDAFIAKYLADGTFQWLRTGGGNGGEVVVDIATNITNDVYVTGRFETSSTFGSISLTGTDDDVFLIKYNSAGTIQWGRSGGGAQRDEPAKIEIDDSGNVILVGYFRGSANFDCISFSIADINDAEIFILKYAPNGNLFFGANLGYSTSCSECVNTDRPKGFGIDASENLYMTGQIVGPVTWGSTTLPAEALLFNDFISRFSLPTGSPCTTQPNISVHAGPDTNTPLIINNQSTVINVGTATMSTDVFSTFTIFNSGTADLSISNITISGTAFSVSSFSASTISSSAADNFTIQLSGAIAGTFSENVTILSNDPTNGVFLFPISGTIDAPVCASTPTVNAGTDQLICPGATAILSAVLGGSATSATWSTSGSGTFDDNTSTNAVYTPSAADETSGAITLTYTVAATAVCPQVTDDVVISIAQPIVAGNPIANANVAQPSSINVIGNSTVNNGDVITVTILQNPSQGAVTINTDNTIQYVANNGTVGSDNFQYRICNQCGQCSDGSVSVSIVNEAPTYTPPSVPPRASLAQSNIVTIAIQSIIGDVNNNIDFASVTNLTSSGNANISYDPSTGIITIDYTNASIVDPNNLSDQITFTICDQLGACSDISFNVEVEGEIIVYNGVSPNGDGLNDFLFIENIQILGQQNNVSIYNRWGDKVFEMDNYNPEDRDRRFEGRQNNGKELPSGVYFYKVEFVNGRPELSGYITLKK